MRTHRIIFWTTLLLFVVGLPTILSINFDTDIKNILIGIICSSLVAAIVELPNLLNYKSSIKSNIYDGLLSSKMFLLQYNDNIDKRLKENDFKYTNYGGYYLNYLSNYINLYNQSDNTIFIDYCSKKNDFLYSKKDFYNLYNSIVNKTLLLEPDLSPHGDKLKENSKFCFMHTLVKPSPNPDNEPLITPEVCWCLFVIPSVTSADSLLCLPSHSFVFFHGRLVFSSLNLYVNRAILYVYVLVYVSSSGILFSRSTHS